METRIIIAGCRHFTDYALLEQALDDYLPTLPPTDTLRIISGTAKGADTMGETYAATRGIPVMRCPADWARYGRAAGPRRNEDMAVLATADGCRGVLVAFWDEKSRGTASMIREAKKHNLEIRIIKIPS